MVDTRPMPVGESFVDLVDAARRGEKAAFGEIFTRLNPQLVSYLGVISRGDAEDLSSETWISVFRNLSTFEGDERAFKAWMFTIARRKMIDVSRGAHRRLSYATDPANMDLESHDFGPESVVLEELSVDELSRHLVRNLTADQAEVVLLGAIGGLRATEIAEVLGKSAGSVRMLQHKALRRLARSSDRLFVIQE